jgi:hypothetical protein
MDAACLKQDVRMYYRGPLSATGERTCKKIVFAIFPRLREDAGHGSHIAFVLCGPFGSYSKDNSQGRNRFAFFIVTT